MASKEVQLQCWHVANVIQQVALVSLMSISDGNHPPPPQACLLTPADFWITPYSHISLVHTDVLASYLIHHVQLVLAVSR
jgi:hypothetical protein